MTHEQLASGMERALATGQIGERVAIRLIAQDVRRPDQLEARFSSALELGQSWMGATIEQLTVLGGRQIGELAGLLRFSRGGLGLVTCGAAGEGPCLLEATVFGQQGMLAWQPDSAAATWEPPAAAVTSGLGSLIRNALAETGTAARERPGPSWIDAPTEVAAGPLQPPYGVLLVAGDHTHQPGYAQAFAADPRCRLVAVTDEAGATSQRHLLNRQLAQRLGATYINDLSEALARSDVQVASICAEPRRRARLIVQAAQAGKHLYLDKPLCARRDEIDPILAAVRDAGVVAHMFSQVLWEPSQRAARLLDSGQLGRVRAIHADLCFAKGPAGTARLGGARCESAAPDVFELPEAKRELTNIGVYHVVLLLRLLQRPVVRVRAATGNFFFAEHQEHDLEDFGQILMQLADGTIASLTAARTGWRSHPGSGLHRICLLGSAGAATVDASRPRIEVCADRDPWTAPPRDPADPMGMWAPRSDNPYRPEPKQSWILPSEPDWSTDVTHFLDCVQQGRRSAVPVELAAAATRVLIAAYESAARQSTVEL